jgi:hypothetical protein
MALRFNGQLPTSTTGSYSAFAGRLVGTASGVTIQTGMLPLWGTRRNQTAAFGNRSAQPDGTNHPVAWLMPLQSGRISARSCEVVFTVGGSGTLGRPIIGSSSITFVVSPAQLNLVVSAIGSTSVTFTTTGGLAGALNATGSTTVTVTVNAATIGAIVNLIGTTVATFTNLATIRATGNLAGDITPFTPLSPQSLAAAVWEALSADYNAAGTMGNKLNSAASAGDPWSTALPGSYVAGEAGYILGSRVLTEDDINKIADIVLRRSTANVEASSDGDTLSLKSLYGMVAQGVHNTQVSGASLTVTKSDDTTVLGTRTVTTDSTAEPIIGINSD